LVDVIGPLETVKKGGHGMASFRDEFEEFAGLSRRYPSELMKRQGEGKKVVCYYGSRVPVEIIHASGASQYPLFDGGDTGPGEAALQYLLPFINAQALYQVGQHVAGLNLITPIADRIIVDCKEADSVRVGDVFEFLGRPVWKLGVPQDWDREYALKYYKQQLENLRDELARLTGEEVTNDRLDESIKKYNRIRELLGLIGALRKQSPPVIGGEDFIKLNHFAMRNDADTSIIHLERIYQALQKEKSEFQERAPRILVAGRGFAFGDYTPLRIVEECGGALVTELLDEGIVQPGKAKVGGDPIGNIAQLYFRDMVPSCFFTPSWGERWGKIESLIEEYKVSGMLYYMPSFDVIYDYEYPVFSKRADEKGIPFEMIESSYNFSREATETLRTRVESFIKVCGR
jgi:benzoyl-CoA reductase/2-hydroxyglutaryl-CoA dehydratase subunit BcrC/BadD/HgdB